MSGRFPGGPGEFARPPSSPGGAYGGGNFGGMQMPPGGPGGFPPGTQQGTPPGFPQGSLGGMPGPGLGPGNPGMPGPGLGPGNPVGFPQGNFGGMPQGPPGGSMSGPPTPGGSMSGGMSQAALAEPCYHCGDRNAQALKGQLQQATNYVQQMEQQMRLMQERAIRAEEQVQHTGMQGSQQIQDFDARLRRSDDARVDAEQKLRIVKQEKQELVERVSVLERERQMPAGSLVDSAALQEKREYMKKIDELQDAANQHQQQQIHAMSEVQRLQEVVATLEARHLELTEQNDELREDLNIVESEAVRLEALNKALQTVVDEKEVQVAALQLYEAEFDRTFSAKLDEREQAFKVATAENQALAVKVRELQDELGHCQKTGVQGNVQELTDMLREMQEKIYDLEDDIADYKDENTRLKYELEQAGGVHVPGVALPAGGVSPVPVSTETQRDQQLEEMQQRLANFQTDKVDRDQKIQDLERKLDEFARGMGAQGLLGQNRQYERQVQDMKKQVAEAKHDLSQYLSDAASLVHENDMLRQFLNKTPEEIQRDLPKYKLKDKVTSSKAVSEKRELEFEVAALEDERMKLKTRLKQMSGLAAEKVALLHDLQPEQMLHLEEIAASMRRGKYEPPLTDESRQLKKEKEELQKKLNEKDAQFAAHIDDRISSLLEKTGATKDLETKLAALQQENLGLRDTLKMLNDGIATQMGGMPFELQQMQAQLQNQVSAQLQNQAVPRVEQGVGPSMPPTPAVAGHGVRLPPMSPSASSIQLNFSNIGGNVVQAGLAQKMQKAQKAQMAMSQSMMGGSMGPVGMSMMGGGGMGAMPMPSMLGMPPMAWSPLMQAHVQQPRELADGSQATTCALYCKVVETVEELEKERALRKSLSEDVEVFSTKYDRLLAQQEVLYKDYFRQRANWEAERKGLEDRLKLQNDMIADTRRKAEDHERQNRELQEMVRARAPGEADGEYKTKLIDAMTRIAALEQNESVLTRKCDSAQQEHSTVRQAFDNLEKDLADRDKYLKERLAKALLWKKSASNLLRFARKRLSQMVPAPSFERVQQELVVSKRRELDLARRQSDQALANARNEDRLREMSDLQERSSNLDIILRETEQEFTVLRRRLQRFDQQFASECSLFARLAAEVQQRLGLVGQWDPVQRALIAELGVQVDGEIAQLQSIDVLFDDRLRRLDTNNDGFVTLGDVIGNFENMGLKVSAADVTVLAEAFHIVSPLQPKVVQQPGPGGVVPSAPASATASLDVATLKRASVSVLAVVGRLRLFGLRRLEPEDLFWTSVQASMMRRQIDSQRMCKTHFQVLRHPNGFITVLDILRVLGSIDVAAEKLPTRGLRRVLGWLGVEARVLDQEAPLETLPKPGDPMDAAVREKFAKMQLIYHDFESRFEKNCARAAQILCPPEAYPDPAEQSSAAALKITDPILQCQMAEAREAASNRRCVVLEQEVRTKVRTVKELQRQVTELEHLTQRLESELHEERGRGVEIKSRLDTTLLNLNIKAPEDTLVLEQKLKKLDESTFQLQQVQFELQQEKDMRRTCANQAESYEKLVKRRQQEVRHLQETVKMIQSKDEVSNTVGKIQYRLLLSLWEKSNLQRQLEAATRELKQVRTQYTEYETEIEKEKNVWHQEHESLQQRLVDANQMTATYQEQATGSMPMEKARELTAKVDQIASSKSALEEKLVVARKQLHRNETERQEFQLKAEQAKFLYDELAKFEATSKAPEMADQMHKSAFERLREIAEKLEASKLLELRHKRDLEISKEEYTQTLHLRKADEQEIQRLQKEVAQAEKRLIEEGEQWREKMNTIQKAMLSSGAYAAGTATTNADGTQSPPIMRFRGGTTSQVEELTNRLNDKDTKITELQANLEKLEADKKEKIADEQMRYRKLERELDLVTNSDPARLRAVLRAEHEEEIKQVSAAAHESVQTLQELLNQADAGINERDQKIQELLQAKRTVSEGHKKEIMDLQNQIKELRIKNIGSTEIPPTPASAHGSMNLHESLLEASMQSLEGFGVEPLLEERREELYRLQNERMQQRQQQESQLQQLQQDAVKREQGLREDYHAREKQLYAAAHAREQEFRKREQEVRQRCEYLEEQIRLVHTQGQHGIAAAHEEVRKSQHHAHAQQQNLQVHALNLEEQKMATDLAQAEVRQLRVELEAEREKNKQANMRKQQAALREQMNKKQEQLDRQRHEVQELKNQFVQMSVDRDREKAECQQARAAEAEMRSRVGQLEERLRGVNEHVTRLTQQLQDQKQQASHEVARMADNRTREQELERLLDEASARLAERSNEARRAAETSHQHQAMRDSAEQMLKSEREVLMGDVCSAKEEARVAVEANTKRISTLHERIDEILAERDQLLDKLQSYGGSSPRIVSDLQDKLRKESVLREQLQGQVSDLQSKLELSQLRKGLNATSPRPRDSSPLRLDMSAPLPSSPQLGGVGFSAARSRSASPITQIQPNHLIAQAAELTAKCNQLEIESAAARAKVTKLEQENDDMKLKLMTQQGTEDYDRVRFSSDSYGGFQRNVAADLDEERVRSRMLEEQGRQYNIKIQQLQQRLKDVTQQLDVERDRVRTSSQALEAERRNVGRGQAAPPLSMSSFPDAAALARLQSENDNLRNQLRQALEDNVRLNRESNMSISPSNARSNTITNPQVVQLQSQLADARSRLEEMLQVNNNLRRSLTPERAATMQADVAAMNVRFQGMQSQLEQLMTENVELRRSASPDHFGNADLGRQVANLKAKNAELLREVVHLQRDPGGVAMRSDSSGLQQRLNDAQAQVQMLMQENVQLRREAGTRDGATMGNADTVELVAARRQIMDLQSRMDQLVAENVQLQRTQPQARIDGPPGGMGLGQYADEHERGQLRKLHDENRAQRKALELLLARAALDTETGASFAPLVEEIQQLERRVQDLNDENISLRLRLPQAMGPVGGGVLPQLPPVAPGSLQEAQEANVILLTKFEAMCNDQAGSVRRLQEVTRRVDELLAENMQLQRQCQRPTLITNDYEREKEHEKAREAAEADRDRAEKNHRAAAERLRLQTARVAELTADKDELHQKLREATIREFALTRQGRPGVGGELRTAEDDADRQYLLAKVDSLQNENDQLRQWSERQQLQLASDQGDATLQFKKDHQSLMERNSRLTSQNQNLQREVAELQRERALRPEAVEISTKKMAAYEDDLKLLKLRNEELEREMTIVRRIPENSMAIFDTAKSRIEQAGVTLLQVLKALDFTRQGRLPLQVIDFAMRKLPLMLPNGDSSTFLLSSVRAFHDDEGSIRYVDWLDHLLTLPGEAFGEKFDADARLHGRQSVNAMGILDEAQHFRGFSLRSALLAIDQDGDGLIPYDQLNHAFATFFEFLKQDEVDMLANSFLEMFGGAQDHSGKRPVSLMDVVWKLDTAFLVSRGQLDAMQALEELDADPRRDLQRKIAGDQAPSRSAEMERARGAADTLRKALKKRGLSLVAILADLDPLQHGQVLFDAFRVAATRYRLGLSTIDLGRLKSALQLNSQGRFATSDLVRLMRALEAPAQEDIGNGQMRGVSGNATGEALEGLPPQTAPAARRRIRSTGGYPRAAPPEAELGPGEARHRRQVEALNASLHQAEEDKKRLQRELNEMKQRDAEAAQRAKKEAAQKQELSAATTPQSLKVLLAAGESAATVKELRLEVQGTRDLRDKLFAVETQLEECHRRLHVDVRAELEREQQKVRTLQHELEERERTIAHIGFDLKRARAAATSGDVAEEYHMTLDLQLRRGEEELAARKKNEVLLSDKLLEQSHQTMEMRFEREQAQARASRLENRLLELELLATAPAGTGGPSPTSHIAPASKQVKSLEQVIEGLERVIAQQKAELKRLKDDADGRHDDRRQKAEAARLRKKIEALEEQLGAQDQQNRRGRSTTAHRTEELNHARKAQEMAEVELRQKEAQIIALEQQLRDLSMARSGGRLESVSGDASGDAARLGMELQELRLAREADATALDEAQRALHEAELTEKRYVEVARENKRLRAEMGALEDEGFWREIEALQARADEGNKLLQESREALCSLFGAFPSLEPPSALLVRIDRHMSTSAPAA